MVMEYVCQNPNEAQDRADKDLVVTFHPVELNLASTVEWEGHQGCHHCDGTASGENTNQTEELVKILINIWSIHMPINTKHTREILNHKNTQFSYSSIQQSYWSYIALHKVFL